MANSLREDTLYVANILGQTDLFSKQIQLIKTAIELNPDLSEDERELLSSAYKNKITQPRKGIRRLQAIILQEQENLKNGQDTTENRIQKLIDFKNQLLDDMEKNCEDCINLVEEKLLPVAKTPEAKVFYKKMEGDYYRYFCEFIEDEGKKKDISDKTKACYDAALEIAKQEIPQYKPLYLSLLLNYSVFYYEILNEKEEALQLSEKTYNDSQALIEQNSEKSRDEARMILQILQDNITHWKGETSEQ